jgi:hypothetical protein
MSIAEIDVFIYVGFGVGHQAKGMAVFSLDRTFKLDAMTGSSWRIPVVALRPRPGLEPWHGYSRLTPQP